MDGINRYKENAVTTQTPGHLIVMLYEGAIKFLEQAIQEMEAGNIPEKGRAIGRALDIIIELDSALNMQEGGQIAKNLRSLYDFMIRQVNLGHLRNDPRLIRDVIALLEELNEGWKAVVE